jgi:anti-anti-sigma regulatory factor
VDRSMRELSASDSLEAGDHVGWIVRDQDEFNWLAGKYLEQGAAAGDKLFLFEPARRRSRVVPIGDGVTVLDPGTAFLNGGGIDAEVMVANLREQDARARQQGYRGIRIVADMDWLLDIPAPFAKTVDFEQRLDRLVAETASVVVCGYRSESFGTVDLSELLCVHPHGRHPRQKVESFRIWNVGGERWRLAGDIDINSIDAFAARLASAAAVASDAGALGLDLRDVGFIDLAGLRAIARYSAEQQVNIVVEGLGKTMRRCWDLLDLDAVAPDVELRA